MPDLPVFDCGALFGALDARRRERGLGWYELAAELWQQSSDLNARRRDHPLCGGAVARLQTRGAVSCQYALFMLRWLSRAPEDFLTGPVVGAYHAVARQAGRLLHPPSRVVRPARLAAPPSGGDSQNGRRVRLVGFVRQLADHLTHAGQVTGRTRLSSTQAGRAVFLARSAR